MIQIIWRRVLQALLMAWSVGTLTFVLVRSLSDDMAFRIAAGRYGEDAVTVAAANAVTQELGLDRPALLQYLHWLYDLVSFNLGTSMVSGRPIIDELSHQLGYTLSLAAVAMLLSIVIALPLGIASGFWHNRGFDKFALVGSIIVRSQPVFTLGLLLIFPLALWLQWLPVAGFGGPQYIVLPAITLALSLAALSNRIVSNSTRQVIQSSYYQFAQIKGLGPVRSFFHHGLRNILVPVVALMGLQLIGLVEGVIMVESLFAWPGIGHALSHAVFARDIPMLQGTALVMGFLFVAVNTLVDIINYYLDPRGRS